MNRNNLITTVFAAILLAVPYALAGSQTLPDVAAPVQNAVDRQTERTQAQAERAQQQAERVQNQAERAGQQIERAQSQAERVGERLPSAAEQGSGRLERGVQRNIERSNGAVAAVNLPERLAIPDRAGNAAFVEIAIEPGIRVVESEWVMLLTAEQREQLEREAPELMRFLDQARPFEALDSEILTFRVPPDIDSDAAIRDMVPESLQDLIDRNHIYSARSGPDDDEQPLPLPMTSVCTDAVAVGMIDSVINTQHPAFQHHQDARNRVVSRNFLDEDVTSPSGHGTAVAGLLTGQGPELTPLLPDGRLYSASVIYSQDAYHQGATVVHLLEALDWLMRQDLAVINMSLTGPPNRLLERGIIAVQNSGTVIVAAAGNEGPHGPLRYPAAYENVVGVTAVDRKRSIYRWANQGEHVDFAAIGVSVPTARGDGSFGRESGTSMATPVVSAFLACALLDHDPESAIQALRKRAVDLGEPGHDPVFGHGLLHP